jgi:hypothetical protein
MHEEHGHEGKHAVQRSFHEEILQELVSGCTVAIVAADCNKPVTLRAAVSTREAGIIEPTTLELTHSPHQQISCDAHAERMSRAPARVQA